VCVCELFDDGKRAAVGVVVLILLTQDQ
jgi:hypothetical protein